MSWIKCNSLDDLPKDKKFLCVCKGTIGIGEKDDESDSYDVVWWPESCAIYRVTRSNENKITHWMPMPNMPDDYYR